jgi:hypothetical protein
MRGSLSRFPDWIFEHNLLMSATQTSTKEFPNMKYILTAVFLLSSSFSYAECDRPEAPVVPDGAVADLATMVEGQKAVKAYVHAVEKEYLPCLTAATEAAGEEDDDAAAARAATYNAAVDKVTAIGEEFNAEIREYKANAAQ